MPDALRLAVGRGKGEVAEFPETVRPPVFWPAAFAARREIRRATSPRSWTAQSRKSVSSELGHRGVMFRDGLGFRHPRIIDHHHFVAAGAREQRRERQQQESARCRFNSCGELTSWASGSIASAEQRLVHPRHRRLFRLVPVTEARAPIPDAPADLRRFRRAADGGIKIRPRLRVRLGERAELAKMNRASVDNPTTRGRNSVFR